MKELLKSFKDLEIMKILRSKIARADVLSHLATSDFFELNQKVLIDIFEKSSIEALPIIQLSMNQVGSIR